MIILVSFLSLTDAHSADPTPMTASPPPNAIEPNGPPAPDGPPVDHPTEGKTSHPEEEDFANTPFTDYGEFNEASEEESDALFFQFGRFFGLSLGIGFETVDGNRGLLWQGGMPMVDVKVHYWFDFNIAMTLGFYTAPHYFTTPTTGQNNVSMFTAYIDAKYYFSTKDLSAALSFANPYLMVGAGIYNKSEYAPLISQVPTQMSSVGVSVGVGLEFIVAPKKTYLEIEGKMHIVNFADSGSNLYQTTNQIPNLSGNFWTISSNLLFTW